LKSARSVGRTFKGTKGGREGGREGGKEKGGSAYAVLLKSARMWIARFRNRGREGGREVYIHRLHISFNGWKRRKRIEDDDDN
jgi:hypothetical protein